MIYFVMGLFIVIVLFVLSYPFLENNILYVGQELIKGTVVAKEKNEGYIIPGRFPFYKDKIVPSTYFLIVEVEGVKRRVEVFHSVYSQIQTGDTLSVRAQHTPYGTTYAVNPNIVT